MLYILIIIGIALRLAPHPVNVTPIMALGVFSGCYINKKAALLIPLTVLFISDMFIGFYDVPVMISVYLSFALGGLIGVWLKNSRFSFKVLGGSLFSSIIFFIITNFAIWAFTASYSHTLDGFITCYIKAIPFFRNSLLGNLGYTAIFFSVYEFYGKRVDDTLTASLETYFTKR